MSSGGIGTSCSIWEPNKKAKKQALYKRHAKRVIEARKCMNCSHNDEGFCRKHNCKCYVVKATCNG